MHETQNTLYYGDNLPILRDYIASESVDLVYLDPPFNSNRNYNVLFRDERGAESEAQITAFEDTWHWDLKAELAYNELVTGDYPTVGNTVASLRVITGQASPMSAYLVMMAARLVELHRILKPTGSLYLHCDPTASHYLKLLLDTIFSPRNFRNEVVWRRSPFVGSSKQRARFFPHNHDILLVYSKTETYTFTPDMIPYTDEYKTTRFKNPDNDPKGPWQSVLLSTYSQATLERLRAEGALIEGGKQLRYKFYLKDSSGGRIRDDVWYDEVVQQINPVAKERLGYPTQKPLALMERIIKASSNPGDVVLDPFAGCGTTIAAAEKLGRRWIGIDITHLSVALLKYRLVAMYPNIKFKVVGEPEDIGAARQLASEDRYQFQWWALSLVKAKPLGGQGASREGKKGSDQGIDGIINFIDDNTGKPKRVLIQVKSGHVSSSHIRDLLGTVQREGAAIGVYITLEEPTRDMNTEAVKAGFYHSAGWGKDYPKIQILTVGDLLKGAEIKMPPAHGTFKEAQRVKVEAAQTSFGDMDLDMNLEPTEE